MSAKLTNPKWVKPSMSVQQAANQAQARGYKLELLWNPMTGLRVVATSTRECKK